MATMFARTPCSTLSTARRSSAVVAVPRAPVCCQRRGAVVVRAAAEPQAPAKPAGKPVEYVEDSEFAISKISFGSILTPVGLSLLFWGFGAYFLLLPGADLSSIMLVYGFPISLLGFALSYAQLTPVTCKTTKEAFALRDTQMTDIQKQIREDTTRFRYGDEQHLEEAMERIFKPNRPGGLSRKNLPTLVGLREEVTGGAYTLVLEFSSALDMEKWSEFQPKFQSFFGPGITSTLAKTEKGVDVALVVDGSGAGRGGKEQKDALPPLLPGLKGRRQD